METNKFVRKKIFGITQRLVHWLIAGLVITLIILGVLGQFIDPGSDKIHLIRSHVYLGYALIVGLGLRCFLGFFGSEYAQFKTLYYSAKHFIRSRQLKNVEQTERFGLEPQASVAYMSVYLFLLVGVISGLVLAAIQYDLGPLSEAFFDDFTWHNIALRTHQFIYYGVVFFIFAHVFGMAWHESKTSIPTAQAMISGYQYRKSKHN